MLKRILRYKGQKAGVILTVVDEERKIYGVGVSLANHGKDVRGQLGGERILQDKFEIKMGDELAVGRAWNPAFTLPVLNKGKRAEALNEQIKWFLKRVKAYYKDKTALQGFMAEVVYEPRVNCDCGHCSKECNDAQ
jgi:hypothetical protein